MNDSDKATLLCLVAGCVEDDDDRLARFRAALYTTAATLKISDQAASNAGASPDAPAGPTPEPAAKGGDSGGRPTVLNYLVANDFKAHARVVSLGEHDRLVAWLEARTADLTTRAENAEVGAAVLREALHLFPTVVCNAFCLPECVLHIRCKRRADALATDAGKKLLAEVEAMRKFVAAFDRWESPRDGGEHFRSQELRQARAAIDEARKS